ncbi:MAG: host attachment protein [Chlamydiia bacterium]|nr:host attachment protein [Chlamydiia bacterium]
MKKMWVLIADSSRAEIVEVEGVGKKISQVQHFKHDKSRARNRAIDTDRPGRMNDRVGGQRHAMENHHDAHTHEREVFARQIVEALELAHSNHQFEEFAIVAPAALLGDLNHAMGKTLKKALLKEVTHDIAGIADEKKRHDLMCKYLDLWNH